MKRLLQMEILKHFRKSGRTVLLFVFSFSNENIPSSTWHPDKIGGNPLSKDEMFSLSDFNI